MFLTNIHYVLSLSLSLSLSQPPGTEPDISGPVWIEHRTSDGQLYYSDPQTQRTTWEKPTGARIIPFNEPTAPPVGTMYNDVIMMLCSILHY